MDRFKRSTTFLLLIGFEAGAIAVLHRLGRLDWMTVRWDNLSGWLDIAPLEDVAAATLRTIALSLAYWIAASTVLYAAAKATRIPGLVRATAWATLPPIRRAIDRSVAIGVTAAALVSPLSPALASESPSTSTPVIYQISDQGVPTPINPPLGPTVVVPPGVDSGGYTPNPAGGVGETTGATASAETIYEVAKGDNLWTISAGYLTSVFSDRDVDASEIATYWRRVIEINTPNIRSGDPNLIFPGEQIVLPAIEQGGDT